MGRNKRPLQLDKDKAKWLGVCAGLANYLEVEAWTVRLVFLGSLMFGGWFLVPLYFIAWYLLEDNSSQLKSTLMESQTVKHFRTVDYRKKLYRNTRNGRPWGVCAGIADYLEVSAFSVRLVFIALTCMTGFPLFFYLGALLVLEKKPLEEYQYESSARQPKSTRFQQDMEIVGAHIADAINNAAGIAAGINAGINSAKDAGKAKAQRAEKPEPAAPRDQYSHRREFQYCARKFATLRQRLARLEAYVTSNRFKLQREFRNMS
jgi:phage shock protein PspC (stress-responsive transcriptional regulator)